MLRPKGKREGSTFMQGLVSRALYVITISIGT